MKRLAMLALVLASGCMSRLAFVESGIPLAHHPNVEPGQVRLYRASDALPSYVEIGYLEYDQIVSFGATNHTQIQHDLAVLAASHGCNAVILHDGCVRFHRGRYSTATLARVPATCIWADGS